MAIFTPVPMNSRGGLRFIPRRGLKSKSQLSRKTDKAAYRLN